MTRMIADDVEAVARHHRTGRFVREAALRDDECILPRVELDELSDSGPLGITAPARLITEARLGQEAEYGGQDSFTLCLTPLPQ